MLEGATGEHSRKRRSNRADTTGRVRNKVAICRKLFYGQERLIGNARTFQDVWGRRWQARIRVAKGGMLGFGKTTKRLLLSSSRVIDETAASRRDPVALLHKHAIEGEVPIIDYVCHIHAERKLVYIEIPKAASSYVLRKILEFAGIDLSKVDNVHKRSNTGLTSPSRLGASAFSALLLDPATYVFTVTRNPYMRAVSCYFDKFEKVPIGDGSYISNVVEMASRTLGFPQISGRALTWPEFVEFLALTVPLRLDGHWASQASIVPAHSMKVHKIARIETLAEDLWEVFHHLGASPDFLRSLSLPHRRIADARLAACLTPAETGKLRRIYAEDFERFGYSTDAPSPNGR